MGEPVTLYSFGDVDRSGKVRFVAAELGLEVVEERLAFPSHRKPPYTDLNPLGQVPTARFRGRVYVESTAICQVLAEAFDAPKLWIGRGEPGRDRYLYWISVCAETLEGRLVECAVSKAGLLGPEYFALHEATLRRKLAVVAAELPAEGYVCGEAFTVADVVVGYSLRLGVQVGLIERAAVEPYLTRLVERPAARQARFAPGL